MRVLHVSNLCQQCSKRFPGMTRLSPRIDLGIPSTKLCLFWGQHIGFKGKLKWKQITSHTKPLWQTISYSSYLDGSMHMSVYVYRAPDVDLNIEKTNRPKDGIPSAQGLNTQSCSENKKLINFEHPDVLRLYPSEVVSVIPPTVMAHEQKCLKTVEVKKTDVTTPWFGDFMKRTPEDFGIFQVLASAEAQKHPRIEAKGVYRASGVLSLETFQWMVLFSCQVKSLLFASCNVFIFLWVLAFFVKETMQPDMVLNSLSPERGKESGDMWVVRNFSVDCAMDL